jgi:hypothetical protein
MNGANASTATTEVAWDTRPDAAVPDNYASDLQTKFHAKSPHQVFHIFIKTIGPCS